jgi:hypothetical protein
MATICKRQIHRGYSANSCCHRKWRNARLDIDSPWSGSERVLLRRSCILARALVRTWRIGAQRLETANVWTEIGTFRLRDCARLSVPGGGMNHSDSGTSRWSKGTEKPVQGHSFLSRGSIGVVCDGKAPLLLCGSKHIEFIQCRRTAHKPIDPSIQ